MYNLKRRVPRSKIFHEIDYIFTESAPRLIQSIGFNVVHVLLCMCLSPPSATRNKIAKDFKSKSVLHREIVCVDYFFCEIRLKTEINRHII